jgi:hypothetical protein
VRVAGAKIDVRAAGGFVVLPCPGNGRTWIKPLSLPLAKPPSWLPTANFDVLTTHPKGSQRPVQDLPGQALISMPAYCGDTPYGFATLDKICRDIRDAPNGAQECTLNAGAYKIGRLISAGELSDAAVAALIDAGLAMPSFDVRRLWDPALVEAKVRRAVEQGKRRPWTPVWVDVGA